MNEITKILKRKKKKKMDTIKKEIKNMGNVICTFVRISVFALLVGPFSLRPTSRVM